MGAVVPAVQCTSGRRDQRGPMDSILKQPLHKKPPYSAQAEYPVRCELSLLSRAPRNTGSPAFAAMTTESGARPCSSNTTPRSRGAMRPSCACSFASKNQRAQCYPKRGAGKAGCPLHPRPRARSVESTRVSHHRFTGTPGLPCAMVLTVSSALSPVTGLCCHRHQRNLFRELDASVGASGPHGFAVRTQRHSSFDVARVHRIPHPTSVTIAKRPSGEGGTAVGVDVIWVRSEPEYFCDEDWTGEIRLKSKGNSSPPRRARFGILSQLSALSERRETGKE
jgi:hypothetical protein